MDNNQQDSQWAISKPDWSRLDFEIEKVIAKHEALFKIEQISRRKIDEDLPVLTKCWIARMNAIDAASVLAKYKSVCASGYCRKE